MSIVEPVSLFNCRDKISVPLTLFKQVTVCRLLNRLDGSSLVNIHHLSPSLVPYIS